MISSGKTNLF